MNAEEILEQRKGKFLKIGRNKGFISDTTNLSSLDHIKKKNIDYFFNNKRNLFIGAALLFIVFFSAIFFL